MELFYSLLPRTKLFTEAYSTRYDHFTPQERMIHPQWTTLNPTGQPFHEASFFRSEGGTSPVLLTKQGVYYPIQGGYWSDKVPLAKSLNSENSHNLLLTEEGLLYALGTNGYNQLGTSSNCHEWARVEGLPPLKESALGSTHSLVLSREGKLFATGQSHYYMQYGQVKGSLPLTTFRECTWHSERPFPFLRKVSTSDRCTITITEQGELMVVGANIFGELGIGVGTWGNDWTLFRTPPLAQVNVGVQHSLALTETGVVYATGLNNYGQLGIPDRKIIIEWERLPLPLPIQKIYCAISKSFLLTYKGEVLMAGITFPNYHPSKGWLALESPLRVSGLMFSYNTLVIY